jgi:conjugative relaxase-like TrwC/TraI family protein
MQSISVISSVSDALKYFKSQLEDYYRDRDMQRGWWDGGSVAALKLGETVQSDHFRYTFKGVSADGKSALVQNAGSDDRKCGWDRTFSCPKAVSVLWALAPESVRALIVSAHEEAVRAANALTERECGFTRRGQGGKTLEPVKLVFACFTHFTSRSLDPALHTHSLLPNVGLRQDGTTGALYSNRIYELKLAIGRFYRDQLAQNLQNSLGLTIEPQRVGFHIKGVPKELCRDLSKRRQTILRAMEKHGTSGGVAAKVAALDTREEKREVPLEQLFPIWEKVAASYGFGKIEAEQLINRSRREMAIQESQQKVANLQESRHTKPTSDPAPHNDDEGSKAFAQRTGEHSSRAGQEPVKQSRNSDQHKGSLISREDTGTKDAASQERGDDKSKSGEFREEATEYRTSGRTNEKKSRSKARVKSRSRESGQKSEKSQTKEDKKKKGWIRVEKRLLFPNAPESNPLKNATAPVVVIGDKREFRRWGDIMWKKDMKVFQLRVQWKQMFPNSPSWSPAKFAQIPALRVLSPAQLRKAQQAKKNAEKQEERLNYSR